MHDCNLQHLAIEVRLGKYLGSSSFKWEFFKSFFLAKIEVNFKLQHTSVSHSIIQGEGYHSTISEIAHMF